MAEIDDSYPKTSNINNLRFEHDGKVFLLHHSNVSDIEIGDKIRSSGSVSGKQTTAGDTTRGFSYGWDVADIDSVKNAAANQAGARTVYLTTANIEDVLPDINIPGSSARAVKGDLSILDRVSIPTDIEFGSREARSMIYEMIERHGVTLGTREEGSLVNTAYAVSRGEEARGIYSQGRAEMQALALKERFDKLIASGTPSPNPNVAHLRQIYESEGSDALTKEVVERAKKDPILSGGDRKLSNILSNIGTTEFSGKDVREIPKEVLKKGVIRASISEPSIDLEIMEDVSEVVNRNVALSRKARASSKFPRAGKMSGSTFDKLLDVADVSKSLLKGRL